MISRFFFPETLPAAGVVRLPEALAHHASRVLRLRDGDDIVLFDGRGGEIAARLRADGKVWFAELGQPVAVERESPVALVLVQALASGDKMDWIVQKAVELGVRGVIPVQAERSVVKLAGERAAKRVEHWRQVAVAACEQSGRNRLPLIGDIVSLPEYLASSRGVARLLLSPGLHGRLAALPAPEGGAHLLIGPEGGWSDKELAACQAAECTPIGLGPRVLRTETAGLAVLAALQTLWGDF